MPNALRIRREGPASLAGVRGGSVCLAWLLLAGCGSGEPPRAAAKGEPTAGRQTQPATPPSPADRAWLGEVQRRVAPDEYRVRPQGRAQAAGNRDQGLTARSSEEGLTVASRIAGPKSPTLQPAAVAIGALALRADGIPVGTPCSTPGECASGFCVDGVCCATACGGGVATDCQACSLTGGGSLPDGICSPRAVGATCNDNNLCTTADTCNGVLLTCVPGPAVVCADEACRTAGVCNPATGLCVNPPRADGTVCDDNSVCTTGTTCMSGVCGTVAVTCTALSQCHDVGTCDAITGVCSNPVKMNGSACSDGNACTQTDSCQAGTCTGANAVVCPAPDQCHDVGTCDTLTGVCSNPAKVNGSACSDGNACTQTDTCQAGTCTGANPVVCPAPDQCHDLGTCVVATGLCSNPAKADLTACSDGDMCTTLDRCVAGACVMGGILDCNDNDVCTADTCVAGTGCVRTPIIGCGVVVDAATDAPDASVDAPVDGPVPDGAVDRSLDVVASDARDAARDTSVDRTVDGAASDARDGAAADRVTDGAVTDATARDGRDGAAARLDGGTPGIKRVGGGGGCDCDVGRRGPGGTGTVQATLLLGLAIIWFRRRSRKR